MSSVLIVDDEPTICWALETALTRDGHSVTTLANAEEALERAKSERPDAIVLDVRLPGMDGITALQRLQELCEGVPVIIITAFGNLETAVEAIHHGAFDYLTKPFDLDKAVSTIQRALATNTHAEPSRDQPQSPEVVQPSILGSSPAIQKVFREIAIVAAQDVPVLITGESGTGKELVAESIHRFGKRSDGPFIPICIPAMNESIVESELFGHAKGAFTGATVRRTGLLESANDGTAFFDEIGDVALATQVKLLRVIETKSMTPVGDNTVRQSDFRLIAATNRNLEELVASDEFREDLFYRLNVYKIDIPPLRDRPEDIPVLAQHFIQQIDPDGKVSISAAALKELQSREWAGNVRELRNVVEHAVLTTRYGCIEPEALVEVKIHSEAKRTTASQFPSSVREWIRTQLSSVGSDSESPNLLESYLNESEPELIKSVLQFTSNNRQEAARLLGLHRQTLRDKMRKYKLET